jgi:BirA family biotin operon repressor/biotin-[acetyl-CoA-carboxylase] ligase
VEQKLLDSKTIFKLRVLEELSKREVVELDELSRELGLQADELSAIIGEMKENHLIRVEDSSVVWLAGDNPSRIKPWGWSYVYKTIVGSTMHVAKGLPSWSIVVAEYQVHSYGRHGKEWISDLGGVWATFKLPLEDRIAQYLPLAIPVVLCELFRERFGVDAKIKWPNDVVVKGGKLAGIMIEGEFYKNRLHVYVGIGINVNNDPKLEKAVSLKSIVGKLTPRNRILSYLSGVMGRIEKYVENHKKLQAQYLGLLETLGRRVAVLLLRDGAVTGKVIGVTETGDLVVDTGVEKVKFSSTEVYELKYL